MENASNALIIAGAILIGVMILSIGVYLVNSFGNSSAQINKQIEDTKISEFNYSFTKYEGLDTVRAHDIVSVANLAKENNNEKYGEKLEKGDSPYYISVLIYDNLRKILYESFEKEDENTYKEFMNNYLIKENSINPYYFKCTEVSINANTKLVDKIVFELIK